MFSFLKKSFTPSSKPVSLGFLGESIARQFLEDREFHFLARNVAQKFGEIDLVFRAPDSTLVFVEVKTMSFIADSKQLLVPEDNMTFSKMTKIRKICEFYANKYPDLISPQFGWRIDGVMVCIDRKFLTDSGHYISNNPFSFSDVYKTASIRWYDNV